MTRVFQEFSVGGRKPLVMYASNGLAQKPKMITPAVDLSGEGLLLPLCAIEKGIQKGRELGRDRSEIRIFDGRIPELEKPIQLSLFSYRR